MFRLMMLLGLAAATFDTPGEAAGAGGDQGGAGGDGQGGGVGSGAGLLSVAGKTGDAGAGAGGDQGGAAGGDGQGGGDGQNGDVAAKAEAYFPDGLDEKFRGETDRETIDKITADLANRGKAPEKAEGYELSLSDDLKERFGDMSNDAVLPLWKETALELGLSNEQFSGAFEKLYSRMAEAGLIDDPVNVAAELDKLAPTTGDQKSREAAATQRLDGALNWIDGLTKRDVLSAEQAGIVSELATTAEGVKAIEALRKSMTPTGVRVDGGAAAGAQEPTVHEKQMRSMFPSMAAE